MFDEFKHEAFDIVIIAGQSNAVGIGGGKSDYMFEPSEDVYIIEPDQKIYPASETLPGCELRGNIALRFATLYREHGLLENGRRLMIVRGCVSWTGFLDKSWTPDGTLYQRTIAATQAVLELNPKNRVIAVLWHQGELDIHEKSTTYYRDLCGLIGGFRHTFRSPRLPFICGDICHDWLVDPDQLERWSRFTMDMTAACIDTGSSRCVMTYDLKSNRQDGNTPTDEIHFCRDSLRILGDRYFAAYREITGR